MYERQATVKVNSTATISFGSLCWLVWVVFLVLKCIHVLPDEFSWFWVWFPFWLPFALYGAIFIILFIVAFIYAAITERG